MGDKWSLLIVRDLFMLGKQSFNEFIESEESISTNILSDRLNRLTEADIISSRPCEENWKKKIYYLTEKGKGLLPVIMEMAAWGIKYQVKTSLPEEFLEEINGDREKLMEKILTDLKY